MCARRVADMYLLLARMDVALLLLPRRYSSLGMTWEFGTVAFLGCPPRSRRGAKGTIGAKGEEGTKGVKEGMTTEKKEGEGEGNILVHS